MAPQEKRARPMRQDTAAATRQWLVVYVGLTISVVGALLDFASGYLLTPMEGAMAFAYLAEVAMYVLGGIVLVLGVLSVTRVMANRMKWCGLGMEIIGVVMAVVSGLVPGMNEGLSDAMLVIAIAMIIDGALMQRNRGMQKEKSK